MWCKECMLISYPSTSFQQLGRNRPRTGTNNRLFIIHNMQIITIYKRTLCPLINSIIQRKHLPPNKRIIPINKHHYLPWMAIIMYGVINILQRKNILFIYHYSNFLLGNISFLYISLNILSRFIWRCIVNVDDVIILVLLHKNRVEISQI